MTFIPPAMATSPAVAEKADRTELDCMLPSSCFLGLQETAGGIRILNFVNVINRQHTDPFLPRDAMHSAVMPQYVDCPSVTFSQVYRDHVGWNTSRIMSRLISFM